MHYIIHSAVLNRFESVDILSFLRYYSYQALMCVIFFLQATPETSKRIFQTAYSLFLTCQAFYLYPRA